MLYSILLQTADIDRIIDQRSAAAGLAGVLADQAAGDRKRIVLADEADRVVVAAGAGEGDVARDVDVRGTFAVARNGLKALAVTAAGLNV